MCSSSSCCSAARTVRVTMDRSGRLSPGRDQISPQAYRVIQSWNGAVNSLVPATARSTCASPRTARRTAIPCSVRCSSSMVTPLSLVAVIRLLLSGSVGGQGGGDEGVGVAQVAGRVQGLLDLRRGDPRRGELVLDLGSGEQHVAERDSG